jgi:disulfide bond formation protein DsbB
LIALATGGHAALLGGAFLFQLAGYAPCAMCLWQRWPHALAIVFGGALLALIAAGRATPAVRTALATAGGLAAAVTGGIGAFHAGVEQRWWDGPSACSGGGGGLSGLSGADLLSTEIADTVVMCDEIVWQMGLSMAGWNAVASLGLAVLWALAAAGRRGSAGMPARS